MVLLQSWGYSDTHTARSYYYIYKDIFKTRSDFHISTCFKSMIRQWDYRDQSAKGGNKEN